MAVQVVVLCEGVDKPQAIASHVVGGVRAHGYYAWPERKLAAIIRPASQRAHVHVVFTLEIVDSIARNLIKSDLYRDSLLIEIVCKFRSKS